MKKKDIDPNGYYDEMKKRDNHSDIRLLIIYLLIFILMLIFMVTISVQCM